MHFIVQVPLKITMKTNIVFALILLGGFFIFSTTTMLHVFAAPTLNDDNLILEEYTREFLGWGYTTITFVDDDILLLEKNGIVHLIRDGVRQEKPVLEINVDPVQESGLLGITNVGSNCLPIFHRG